MSVVQPKWNRNGKELFYRVGNRMMAVDVSTSPDLTLSQPRVLFEHRYAFGSCAGSWVFRGGRTAALRGDN
jgi:hypothetical protein